jgi:FkbM family methyltransferase
MFRKGGKADKRLKKFFWRWRQPAWAENQGIWLPCNQPGIAPGIARQIYFGEYESKEVDIVASKLETTDTVVEVGAGLGYLSAFCAKRIGNDRVHTFEANPALMPLIRATHERNAIAPEVHNVLLARGDGECTFYVEPEFWASSTTARSELARAIKVPQRDLNAELIRLSPSFLIVDIEGGEAEFFAYADLAGINKICLETHPDVLGNDGISSIFSRLFAQGFVLDFSCIRKNVFFFYRPHCNVASS